MVQTEDNTQRDLKHFQNFLDQNYKNNEHHNKTSQQNVFQINELNFMQFMGLQKRIILKHRPTQ